jgi:hypothetical protein
VAEFTTITCDAPGCGARVSKWHVCRVKFGQQPYPRRVALQLCSDCAEAIIVKPLGLPLTERQEPTRQHQHQARTPSHEALVVKPGRLNGLSHRVSTSEPSLSPDTN